MKKKVFRYAKLTNQLLLKLDFQISTNIQEASG